jgi:hypothetical protein
MTAGIPGDFTLENSRSAQRTVVPNLGAPPLSVNVPFFGTIPIHARFKTFDRERKICDRDRTSARIERAGDAVVARWTTAEQE